MSFRNAKGGYIRPGYDPLEVANPPTGASASAGNQSASVSFTAPTNVGGSAITNYYAVSNPGQITASSVTSPISVTGLTNNTSYTFKVWADNSYGPSAYSAPTGAVTPLPPFIEDVFSTYLYTGNGSTQTITNGIDLSGEGGMVWIKPRNQAQDHIIFDTLRGVTKSLTTNNTAAEYTATAPDEGLSSFNTNGFTAKLYQNSTGINNSSCNNASWTFRQAEKFFDVVTWTGDGTGTRNIAHALASTPGAIFIKQTSSNTSWINWYVYHRANTGTPETAALFLNTTDATSQPNSYLASTAPTSTQFTVTSGLNESSKTYVAYLFAHNAGGFGASGTDNVISCGSYTGNGSSTGPTITLGYEPQWVLIKNASYTGSYWMIYDNMRGWPVGSNPNLLYPNVSDAEANASWAKVDLLPTGFQIKTTDSWLNQSGDTYIYIAIRRGPMKTPTTGTSVFSPVAYTGNGGTQSLTTNFAGDTAWIDQRSNAGQYVQSFDKLRGNNVVVYQNATNAEETNSPTSYTVSFNNTQTVLVGPYSPNGIYNNSDSPQIAWNFRRAPGFFDVVCYSGDGNETAYNHNLGVVPELFIVKSRSTTTNWRVYYGDPAKYLNFNLTSAGTTSTIIWNNTAPTSTTFTVKGGGSGVNDSGQTYICYLFASVTGVSKVGSYTGTGTTQQINCGFTGGARFVLIKRTDSTGDWYVWDTARGIVSGNDPYLLMNSTAAEVTNTDYVDTYSAGFEISSTAPAAINANGGTYIFLAIA